MTYINKNKELCSFLFQNICKQLQNVVILQRRYQS